MTKDTEIKVNEGSTVRGVEWRSAANVAVVEKDGRLSEPSVDELMAIIVASLPATPKKARKLVRLAKRRIQGEWVTRLGAMEVYHREAYAIRVIVEIRELEFDFPGGDSRWWSVLTRAAIRRRVGGWPNFMDALKVKPSDQVRIVNPFTLDSSPDHVRILGGAL